MTEHRPWHRAGVDHTLWERARIALIDDIAEAFWRARTHPEMEPDQATSTAIQQLAELGRGDRDATLYGLKVSERRRGSN